MGLAKYTVWKYIKVEGKGWRYSKAAIAANRKIKPNVVLVDGKEETHPEGAYYLNVSGQWLLAGKTSVEAQDTQRKHLARQRYERETGESLPGSSGGTPLAEAVDRYFSNLEARGADPKTIRTYHAAIDAFVAQCKKSCVEQVEKQDMLDFMGWLRKQPIPQRRHGNPDRTYNNKVSHVAIFLKAFGRGGLLKKSEYPSYCEKEVTAHSEEELDYLYSRADADDKFFLDFMLGTGFREGEAMHAEYADLAGDALLVRRKPQFNWKPKKHHCRRVEIDPALADAIRARGNGKSGLIFPNSEGKPDGHLLRRVQRLAAGGGFHSENHKLRKTWASRSYLAGVPIRKLQLMLGHKSLVTTERYLADIELSKGDLKRAITAATYVPKPKVAEGAALAKVVAMPSRRATGAEGKGESEGLANSSSNISLCTT